MSILKVANVHFDSAGTNRLEYIGTDNIVRVAANAIKLPVGNTASRPTGEQGLIRFNSETGTFEGRNTSAWGAIGGSTDLSPVFSQANAAYDKANTANITADLAFNKANSTTYTSNVVISVADNTNAALRITQTGTAAAIRVEDETNPDATPFIVDATGNVGIGLQTPLYKLDVRGTTDLDSSIRATNNGTAASNLAVITVATGGGVQGSIIAQGNQKYLVGSDTNYPLAFRTNAIERVTIDTSGNVLIGRTDSTVGLGVKLDVNGAVNASAIYVNGTAVGGGSSVNVYTDTANTTRFMVFADATSGTFSAANTDIDLTYNPSTGVLSSVIFNSTSDINKKENIIPVTGAMDILEQLDGVRFTWKNNGMPSLGVIAQTVEKVLPELVDDGKSVNYNGIIAVLIEAIKELKAEVETLKAGK